MRREDIEKLLGGWAAGTLTDAERSSLMQAALEDQDLFDRLIEEEPLRETLADPVYRARVARALEPRVSRTRWFRSAWAWGFAGTAAATAVVVFGLVEWNRSARRHAAQPASEIQMAQARRTSQAAKPEAVRPAAPPATAAPEQQPARQRREAATPEPERDLRTRDVRTAEDKESKDAASGALAFANPNRTTASADQAPAKQKTLAATPAPAVSATAESAAGETARSRSNRVAAPGRAADAAIPPPPAAAPSPQVMLGEAGGVPVGAPPLAGAAERKREAAPAETTRADAPSPRREGARAAFERGAAARAVSGSSLRQRTAAAAAGIGLRYRILRREAGPAGAWTQADPDETFDPSDALRLELAVNERAYYYVIVGGSVLASGIAQPAVPQVIPLPAGAAVATLIASRAPLGRPLEAAKNAEGTAREKSGHSVYLASVRPAEQPVVAQVVLRYR